MASSYALSLIHIYTIDWLAPISLPLFVGVETWNAFQEDGEFSLARVLDTMTSITEPMMNLTLLQGINSAIKTAGYSLSLIHIWMRCP